MDEFQIFLEGLSKHYDSGNNLKWLRMLLYGILSIGDLDQSALGLFNKLTDHGFISKTDVRLLQDIAEVTIHALAKTCIQKYRDTIQSSDTRGTRLTAYRRALFTTLTNVGNNDVKCVVDFYKLNEFSTIWDAVYHLEKAGCLDSEAKCEQFAKLLNKVAQTILLATPYQPTVIQTRAALAPIPELGPELTTQTAIHAQSPEPLPALSSTPLLTQLEPTEATEELQVPAPTSITAQPQSIMPTENLHHVSVYIESDDPGWEKRVIHELQKIKPNVKCLSRQNWHSLRLQDSTELAIKCRKVIVGFLPQQLTGFPEALAARVRGYTLNTNQENNKLIIVKIKKDSKIPDCFGELYSIDFEDDDFYGRLLNLITKEGINFKLSSLNQEVNQGLYNRCTEKRSNLTTYFGTFCMTLCCWRKHSIIFYLTVNDAINLKRLHDMNVNNGLVGELAAILEYDVNDLKTSLDEGEYLRVLEKLNAKECSMCAANLIGALRSYRQNEVNISQHEQTQAKEAVEKIKNVFVRSHHSSPFNFRQIFHQGSSYEGLKVMKADEFDLLVPLDLSTNWRITEGGLDGYYLIEKTSHSTDSTLGNLIQDGRLNPDRVRRSMQSTVQTVVNGMGALGMRINLSYSGPAITLDVRYNGRSMSIDIVPSLNIGGRQFVAKSPRHLHTSAYDQLWRESFSDREKSIFNNIDRINECRRDTLKILKTVQKKAGLSQLGMLSSYHLKTCMLHLNNNRPHLSWHQESLADRFKDLVQTLMHFLETRNMPNFFRGSVNLLDRYDADSLNNILGWLRRAMRDDEHIISVLLN